MLPYAGFTQGAHRAKDHPVQAYRKGLPVIKWRRIEEQTPGKRQNKGEKESRNACCAKGCN